VITYKGDELFYDGHSISKLADHLPTPFFLFSEHAIRANYTRLTNAFAVLPSGVLVDYCVKANYELALLGLLRDLGAGAMISCGWELDLALAAGFRPERVTFHGPCKTQEELDAAVSAGMGLIHVYSVEELEQLSRIAAAYQRKVNVSLRLPAPGPWLRRGLPGWYARRLGIPWNRVVEVFQRASSCPWLCPIGFSVYIGTQVTRPNTYIRALYRLFQMAERLSRVGIGVREITLGGGWPSDTLQKVDLKMMFQLLVRREPWPPGRLLESLARRVAEAFLLEVERSRLPSPPLLRLEPGRGLVGPAGLLVTRVRALRGQWVFVDASRNFLPELLLFARRPILPAVTRSGASRHRYHLSGTTLNTMDVLALGVRLPPIQAGDVLVFLDAGAYSLSRACRYAGGIPDAYLLTRAGELLRIRKRDRYDDIVASMVAPGQRAAVLE